MNKRYSLLPEDYLAEECTTDNTYEDVDLLCDDEVFGRYIERERAAFREEWFRYISEYE
mgnify:FL=1|nr:MAG TPA: hypothetical protein [Caudoviricetes sp.]